MPYKIKNRLFNSFKIIIRLKLFIYIYGVRVSCDTKTNATIAISDHDESKREEVKNRFNQTPFLQFHTRQLSSISQYLSPI